MTGCDSWEKTRDEASPGLVSGRLIKRQKPPESKVVVVKARATRSTVGPQCAAYQPISAGPSTRVALEEIHSPRTTIDASLLGYAQ